MRGFIVLALLVAAASAGKLGYNYGPGISQGIGSSYGSSSYGGGNIISGGLGGSRLVGGGTTLIGAQSIGSGIGGLIGSGIGGSIGSGIGGSIGSGIGGSIGSGIGGSIGSGIGGSIGSGIGGSIGSGIRGSIGGGSTTVVGIDAVDSIPQTVEYNKQVFYFSAPEEAQNEGQVTQQLSNVLKKNLQVVFIKAPENNAATNAALQLAKQAIEQRTAIYVLSKENDASQIVGQLQQIQENVPTVPEVRIIKYRTQEDLANAQATIQAQYDNIGGPSPLINGGVAPVLNYASPGSGSVNIIGGGINGGQSYGSGIGIGGIQTVSSGLNYGSGLQTIGGGITKIIGGGKLISTGLGGVSSTGGYLPPGLRK